MSGTGLHVDVVATTPLTLHVSLLRDAGAVDAAWVPRLLEPLGAFVSVTVHDGDGTLVLETHPPKAKPKLDPDDDASYLPLDPGHTHGAVLEVGDVPAGTYRVTVAYSTFGYDGTEERPVGDLSPRCEVEVVVG